MPALCGTHPRKDLLSTKEPLRAGCLQRDVLFQLQSIALPGDDVYSISHSSIEPPEMRSMRQELWRHPSLWLERKDILTLRCCGREPLQSLNDVSAWRRVVLICVEIKFQAPTPSTRCCLPSYVCSMAWGFTKVHAIFLRIT